MKGLLEFSKTNTKIEFKFYGIGGPRMNNLGIKNLFNYKEINFLGFLQVLLNVLSLKRKLNFLTNYILELNPDLIITVDAKIFSLLLAKNVKKKNKRS